MRVAHFIIALQLGGAERLVSELLAYWRGETPPLQTGLLVTQRTGSFYGHGELEPDLDLAFETRWRSPRLLLEIARVRRFLADQQVEVLHSHWWLPDLISAAACALSRGKKHVVHLHTMMDIYLPKEFRLRRKLCLLMFRLAKSHVVGCSKSVIDDFVSSTDWKGEVDVLPNAVDTESFSPAGASPLERPMRIGMAGRLNEIKGHCVLLESLDQLRQEGIDFHVEIAGDGPEEETIRRRIDELQLGDMVTMAGAIDDMAEFYRRNPVIVQPTIGTEGLPMTILEGMSSGCVVVASKTGGVNEALEHGVNGFLVEPGDIGQLTAALQKIDSLGAAGTREIRAAARERIENLFGIASYSDHLAQLYRKAPV